MNNSKTFLVIDRNNVVNTMLRKHFESNDITEDCLTKKYEIEDYLIKKYKIERGAARSIIKGEAGPVIGNDRLDAITNILDITKIDLLISMNVITLEEINLYFKNFKDDFSCGCCETKEECTDGDEG